MKHYKIKKFANEAKHNDVQDQLLMDTINDFLSSERDHQQKYSLGANLYKLRIATKEGRGKSGGGRTILAFKKDDKVVWMHYFSKNEKGNITSVELSRLKTLSNILLTLSDVEINKLIKFGELIEVNQHV